MKAIVFGGSGFIGSHVADCLTETGYEGLSAVLVYKTVMQKRWFQDGNRNV